MNVKLKINTAIFIIFLVLGGLFFIGKTGFNILSSLRAYVGGEGLWAKEQKEATYQLTQYIFTGEKARYQSFLDRLNVPLGDKVARLELEKPTPVYETIFQGFADGGNHPDDIPSMISLYKKFKDIHYIRNAVQQWEVGDRLIKELLKIGEEIHHHITNNNMSKEQVARYLSIIDALQKRLNEAENQFSYNMSEAARWTANLFFIIMLIFSVTGSIVCFIMLRLISGVIYDLNDKYLQLETQAESERTVKMRLKESEEKYRFVTESATDIIWTSDLGGNISFITPSHEILTGYTVEETIGMNIAKFTTQQSMEKVASMIIDRLETDSERKNDPYNPISVEIESKHKNSTIRQCEVTAKFIRDKSNNPVGIIGITRDITQRKELETQLQQSQKMEAIGTLAGGVAHDFNNILTTIIGNAQLALMDISEDDPLQERIGQINAAAEKAASLTRQLLAFSRKQIIQPEILDLNERLKDLNKMLGRMIKEDLNVKVIPGPLLNRVEIDPVQMEQIIMNLVVNAGDAMPKGGNLIIETTNVDIDENYLNVHHVEGKPGPYVMLAISDTGIGMGKETQKHIFEPFYTTKERERGTGLGLSTIYGIVKQNNGFIWVYSELERGSTFKVYFPAVMEDVRPEGKKQTSLTELSGFETILVVEDDDSVRNLVQRSLQQLGYIILVAENGNEALRISKEHERSIELMLTDVVMPGMSGREVVEQVQPIFPQMKVIYMSGYTDDAIAYHGVLDPGLNFIEKPFSPKELARQIREVLDN